MNNHWSVFPVCFLDHITLFNLDLLRRKYQKKIEQGSPLQLASHCVTGDISFTHSFFYGITEVLFDVILNDIEYDVKQNSHYVIKESVNEVNLVSGSLTPHLPGAPGQGFS